MRLRKKLLSLALVLTLIYSSAVLYINPNQDYRADLNHHDLVSLEPTGESDHVIAYGVDAEEAEKIYLFVRNFLSAPYVGQKVRVYRARPRFKSGAIGNKTRIGEYIGIYHRNYFGPDTIIYNGQDIVLVHEMAHLFFEYLNTYHKSEAFAELVEQYTYLNYSCTTVIQTLTSLLRSKYEENTLSTESVSSQSAG